MPDAGARGEGRQAVTLQYLVVHLDAFIEGLITPKVLGAVVAGWIARHGDGATGTPYLEAGAVAAFVLEAVDGVADLFAGGYVVPDDAVLTNDREAALRVFLMDDEPVDKPVQRPALPDHFLSVLSGSPELVWV